MKLPKHLAKRYSQMTDSEMEGSGQAKDLVDAAMLKSGGRPGPLKVDDSKITQAVLRPGVISWDDGKDAGVWFNMSKAGGSHIPAGKHLNLDKLLHSRYVQQDVQQGHDVMEFPDKKAPTPVQKEKAKMIANVKAADQAAKVEAKATALAQKAKATKDAAMAGLAGLGHFGDIAATQQELVDAQTAAFAPSCRQGHSVFPAYHCEPAKMERFVKAQEALAEAAKVAGDEGAMKTAAEAAAKVASAKQAGSMKMIMVVMGLALAGVIAYLVIKR